MASTDQLCSSNGSSPPSARFLLMLLPPLPDSLLQDALLLGPLPLFLQPLLLLLFQLLGPAIELAA